MLAIASQSSLQKYEPNDLEFSSLFDLSSQFSPDELSFAESKEEYSFVVPEAPAPHYKIEVNPDYVDASKFFGTQNFASRIPGFDTIITDSGLPSVSYTNIIRDQIYLLAGVLDEDKTEEDLITSLYSNSQDEAKRLTLRKNISLSAEEVASLRSNIIWHEPVIRDGKIYNVPRVYLASNQYKKGGLIASEEIDIAAGSIINSNTIAAPIISLSTTESIVNIGGNIAGSEQLTIRSTGDVINIAGNIAAGSADIEAASLLSSSILERNILMNGFEDRIAARAVIDIARNARISTTGDQTYLASTFRAGSLEANAGGDFRLKAHMLRSAKETSSPGTTTKERHLWHEGANLEVAGNSRISTAGDAVFEASKVKIGGNSAVSAEGTLRVASGVDIDEYESRTVSKKRNDIGISSTKVTETYHRNEQLSGGIFEVGGSSILHGAGAVETFGAKFSASRGTQVSGEAVSLLGQSTENVTNSVSNYKDIAWQSFKVSGSSSAKANPTTFEGGVSFGAVTGGIEAEINSSDQKSLELKEALEGRDDATIKFVTDAASSYSKRQSSLTPEATAVLGVALALATGGMALGAGEAVATGGASFSAAAGTTTVLTTGQSIIAGSVAGAVGSATSSYAIATINNQGNLGRAFDQTFSAAGVKNIIAAAVVGGVTSGFEGMLDVKALKPGMARDEVYKTIGQKAAIRAGASTLVYGGGVEGFAKSAALNFGLGAVQYTVGEVAGDRLTEGGAAKTALHAMAGGIYAGATGSNIAAGAMAGGMSELLSPMINSSSDDKTDRIALTSTMAAAAAFVTGADAKSISAAGEIAGGARAHNREMHPEELMVLRIAQEGKSEEEKKRLELAAHSSIHSSEGVPESDKLKPYLVARDKAESSFTAEKRLLQETATRLGVKGGFKYSSFDRMDDALSREYDHLLTRFGGGASLVSGSVGTVSMLGMAAVSGASTAAGNVYGPYGAIYAGSLAGVSYNYASDGANRLLGSYESDLGARVVRSFKEPVGSSYTGRLAEKAGMEAATMAAIGVATKAMPAIDAAISAKSIKAPGRTAAGAGAPATTAEVKPAGSVGEVKAAGGDVKIKERLTPTVTPFSTEYWTRSVEFKGSKVYQRNDLIDPLAIHPKYGISNLEAMKKGYAPIGPDNKPINLHHTIQSEKGAIAEVTETFHRENSKVIHINPSTTKSGITRARFDAWREKYWIERAKDFE